MARKRQEVQLQQEIETQEEWEDMVSKEGVWVIDVYQEWCGPTAALVSTFKRIKLDLGDALLNFAVAKADTIDALEKYRGRCEPCFMFYAGGVLVAVVRGANAPLILRTITEQLAHEHKVIDGTAERKEVKDTVIASLEKEKKEEVDMEEKEEEMTKEVTICLIKPDAVQAGKAEAIKDELRQRGIEILREEERKLTEDEANMIYGGLKDQQSTMYPTFYADLIKFMTSGPSHILVITKGKTGENIIKEFRELLGPTSLEEAKEKAPDSLRAKYGQDTMMNSLHGSSSQEMAMRELAFFFPDFVAPVVEGKRPKLQRTLALIRPDAFKLHKDAILEKIREAGFRVAMEKEIVLTQEQAEDFYSEHRGQPYFQQITERMASGPLLALGLAREDAVQGWRQMLGPAEVEKAKQEAPDSLRAQFLVDDIPINQLHGSSSEEAAEKELKFFFPVEQTVAAIKPDAYGTKDEIVKRIHEAGFRIAARKETKLTREMAEEFYADHKDKEYFNDLVEHMVSGPTFFMILSREDAVEGWRAMIGPTDPEKAKEDPETLRAQFGTDVVQNAVHGSSNPEHVKESIKKIFEEREEGEEPVNVTKEDSAEGAPEYRKTTAMKEEKTEEQEENKKVEAKSPEPLKEEENIKVQQEETERSESPKKDENEVSDEQKEAENLKVEEDQGKDKTQEEGTGEAHSNGEDSKPTESSETEAKPDDKEGVEHKTEEKEENKDGELKEGES